MNACKKSRRSVSYEPAENEPRTAPPRKGADKENVLQL